jgi:transposase
VEWSGRISRCGDEMMRVMLYEAAQSMLLHSKKWSWLKAWAMQIARRRGMKKAIVALARRLAVIMHRIWVDGTEFLCVPKTSSGDNFIIYRPSKVKPLRSMSG